MGNVQLEQGIGKCPECGRDAIYRVMFLGLFPNEMHGVPRYRTEWDCNHGKDQLILYFQCNHRDEELEFRIEELDHVEQTLVDGKSKIYTLHCPDCKSPIPGVYGVKP